MTQRKWVAHASVALLAEDKNVEVRNLEAEQEEKTAQKEEVE
jgi:hypothetical protein